MEDSVPFSVLNERLRPRFTAMERLCTSLNTLEDRSSLRANRSAPRPTVLPVEPVSEPEPEPEPELEQEDPVTPTSIGSEEAEQEISDKFPPLMESGDGLLTLINQCLGPSLTVEDMDPRDSQQLDDVQENEVSSSSEQTDNSEGLGPPGTSEPGGGSVKQGGSPSRRTYLDGTLPDLIRSGRPLSRRRTLGPVSDTLKEVRREVELSRRRSLKLKAQVDKLQESSDGPGWSQHRERVTEEVQSVLRLLLPLTGPESAVVEPAAKDNQLDAALNQLQTVARQLAISHTKQEFKSGTANRKAEEDSAILQQALRDRDEAIEKKKAMEAELLRSKTELMLLNNQLLEAAQKRLELSLELEAWKEDVQHIIHQQLVQQQAEEAQKKPSRLGLLRRNKPVQRPASFPLQPSAAPAHSTSSNQIFISRQAPATSEPSNTPRSWRDRLKKGKSSRQGDQDPAGQDPVNSTASRDDAGFHTVSLD